MVLVVVMAPGVTMSQTHDAILDCYSASVGLNRGCELLDWLTGCYILHTWI